MPSEVKPKFQKSMAIKDRTQVTVDETPCYPEQRLWTAIILFTIQEYEDTLALVKKLWTTENGPVSKYYLQTIRSIRYECRHSWFGHICEHANFHQDVLLKKMKQLDMQYGLAEVEFTDEDNVVTRYQVRRSMQARDRRGMKVKRSV